MCGVNYLGVISFWSNYPQDQLSGMQFSSVAIFQRTIIQWVIARGKFPGGNLTVFYQFLACSGSFFLNSVYTVNSVYYNIHESVIFCRFRGCVGHVGHVGASIRG